MDSAGHDNDNDSSNYRSEFDEDHDNNICVYEQRLVPMSVRMYTPTKHYSCRIRPMHAVHCCKVNSISRLYCSSVSCTDLSHKCRHVRELAHYRSDPPSPPLYLRIDRSDNQEHFQSLELHRSGCPDGVLSVHAVVTAVVR